MGALLQDLRYALRSIRNRPGFTLIVVLTLALGIGVNTAVFSMINAMLIRPWPGDGLVEIHDVRLAQRQEGSASYPDFVDWTTGSATLVDPAAYYHRDVVMVRPGAEAEIVQGEAVTTNLFPLLGAQPALGRSFLPEEAAPGANTVVMLSHKLWTERFGADPGVVGSTVTMDGVVHTIVGVMPAHFGFPDNQLFWVPIAPAALSDDRGARYLRVAARLRPTASVEAAQAELSAVAARLAQDYPESNAGRGVRVASFGEAGREMFRPVLLVMLSAVALVLLIACANVANLFLARAVGRQREIAIRMSLGASRGSIARQLLTESILIALLGGAAGVWVAHAGLRLVLRSMPFDPPLSLVFDIDTRVLLFTLGISVATGLLCALAPLLRSTRPDLTTWLRDGGWGGTESSTHRRMRSTLVVGQLALATVLLIGAMLMVRSVLLLQRIDPGFQTAHLLTAQITASGVRYDEEGARQRFFEQLLNGAATLPRANDAALVTRLPLTGGSATRRVEAEGRPEAPEDRLSAQYRGVSANYFRAIGMPLERGRAFTSAEMAGAAPVVLVNRTLAERLWPEEDAVGKRLRAGDSLLTVVGVVPDARLTGLTERPTPQMYAPFTATMPRRLSLVVRTDDASETAAALRRLVRGMDPGVPVHELMPMDQVLGQSLWQQRLFGGMFTAFASIAVLLAVVGVYGVTSYAASLRTRELGVRMALGATAGSVVRLTIRRSVGLAMTGLALGLVGAFALTRVLASMLHEVSPRDPLVFAGSVALLGATALLAAYLPARRATQVDPVIALRAE